MQPEGSTCRRRTYDSGRDRELVRQNAARILTGGEAQGYEYGRVTGWRYPFNTGCLPLSYSGNPGVNGVSHREGVLPDATPSELAVYP